MFRRSRFSIRPNVGAAGRAAAAPQEAPSVNQEASETPKGVSESSTATAVTENKSVVTPSEKPTAAGDGNDQNGEGTSSSAAVQRRKRFSIKPKVAPGRPSTLARTPKSPVKAVSGTPVEVPGSDLDKPTTSSQTATTAAPQGLQSPRRRRPSEECKRLKVQPKPTLIPSDGSEPSAVPPAEDSPEQTHLPVDSGKQLESTSGGEVKDVPSRLPVPPSLPDKEAIAISEKAKTLMSSKCGISLSAPAFSLSRLLNDPSDLQRLAKARKLRELLREEMHKEKKIKKAKARAKEFTLDPAKMTMRDLIRYLPVSNPMTSSLEDPAPENETVVPPSPEREESPERAQEPEVPPKISIPREGEEDEEEEEAAAAEEEAAEEDQEDALMVPQVRVAEDGSLIIDEESLTVEVQRAKGPNLIQDRDPIFERGSTTTYSSFRKGTYSKPWSSEETDMFFLAISMVGTDFSMICQLFPHRARSEIKNKFKKEERANAWRIDKAFRERRKLDIEYFSKLLEKILEVQKNRKKLKSLAEKNSPKKRKRKAKGKKAASKLSDVEEEDEEEENELPDLEEEEGEKENEDLCNEGGTPVCKPKKKRKRKNKEDAATEEPNDKKNKTGEKSSEQGEACIPEDAEAALPEDRANSDMSENTENVNAAKDIAIKPAKLSRGRAAKPVLPLGRKWGKKPAPPSAKDKDAASDKGDESVGDGASKEQVNEDASPLKEAKKGKSAIDDIFSEEEDAPVQPPRPTRYGRVPKPTKPLNYPAKDVSQSSASETTPASPAGSSASAAKPKPKCTAKRGRSSKPQSAPESKKPKLITLRASQSEYSDEEDEKQWGEEEVEEVEPPACSSSKDSIAPAFVPASLRSPQPVISEVEETMEELDILANMPDVLGISQDALCPDSSFELTQNETGTAEPCEHQLDLLVDVIDFLSAEHTEVSADESYNEAAQTLLTIGNLAHLSQSAQNQTATQDHPTGSASVSVDEPSQQLEVEIASKPAAQEEDSATPLTSATYVQEVTGTSETVATVELQNSTTDNADMPVTETSDQRSGSDLDPIPQFQSTPEKSNKNSPQTRRGRLSKVNPKPNLGQASRTAQSKSQPETSTITAKESQTDAPNPSQATETAAEETPTTADCSQKLSKDEVSCIDVKLTEDQSSRQEQSTGEVKSGAETSAQSASENWNFSEAQFETSSYQATGDTRLTSESTEEILMSHVGTTESRSSHPLTSDSAVLESQVGQGSNIDSAPVSESSNHPAPFVTPVEELPAIQKEESEDASPRQTRKSRFQKVKPKPNLPRTSRTVLSKPQTTQDTIEKDSNPTPNPKVHARTIAEVEADPTGTTSSEKPSQNTGPASDLIPTLNLGSALTPSEELSTTVETKKDIGVVAQVESSAATSDQSTSENQNFSETQSEPSRDQATRVTRPTSESTEEILTSYVGTTDNSYSNLLTSDSTVPELQVGQGSTVDSARVEESSNHPAPCVTPVEDLPAIQKEESEDTSTCQTRSRCQKVKPKPNLPQISRTVRSKPQTTKDTVEKDSNSNSTPNPKFHEKTIEVEAETTCTTSPEKPSQSTDLPSSQKEESEVASTCQTRKSRFSKVKPKPNLAPTARAVQSKPQTTKENVEEDSNLTQSSEFHERTIEVEAEPTCTTSPEKPSQRMVQESSNHPAPCVTPVEDLPSSQKEESEVASTCQTRKSRFSKVKPKPNLAPTARAVRSKPQTTKETVEKDSNLTPNSEFHEKTIVDVEAQPTCTTSSEKQSQRTGSASDLIPSLDLGSTLKPTEELSTTEEKETDVGVVGQVQSGAATLDQSASEKQNLRPTSQSTGETLMSYVGEFESSCSNLTSDSAVLESQVGQGSNIDSATVQENSDHPAPCVTPVEDLPASQKEESEDASTCQTRKSRFSKVKPKPNLPHTSRTVRSKPQTTKDPVTHIVEKPSSPTSTPDSTDNTVSEIEAQPTCSTTPPETPSQITNAGAASVVVPSLELYSTHKATEELSSTEGQNTNVGCALDSSSEVSELNVPQIRQRFPKVKPKPNLGSSTRTTKTRLQASDTSTPSEQPHMDTSSSPTSVQQPVDSNDAQTELKLTEHLTSTHCSLHTELLSSTKLGPAESEQSIDSTNDKGTSSDGIVLATSLVAEHQSVLTDSVLENKSSEKPTIEGESTGDMVEAGPASQSDCTQDVSIISTETNTQPTDDPAAISDVQISEDVLTESKIKSILPANTQSTPDPKESAEALSQDEVQQCSETTETNQTAAQSTDDNESQSTDSSKSSRKAPQTRRGRLVKPKPNLGRRSQPPQPQPDQNTKQAVADLGAWSEGVDASVSHKLVSELQHDIQEPIEGAIEQHSNLNSPPNDAESSLGCLTQVPDISPLDASTSSTAGTHIHPSLTIFPDILTEQVPSDPDEPFFILSLTEIPVCSSGEVVDSASEPLPYLPVTDASVQQQSCVPEAGAGPLSNVSVPESLEESGETGLISVKDIGLDPAADTGSIMEDPVDLHESSTVQPSTSAETVESKDETEPPSTKQRRMDSGRTAKLQVKPRTARKKQASKTLAAKEAESVPTQDSELPGPSVQPRAFDEVVTEPQEGSGDHVRVEKEPLMGGKDPEEGSSGAQTTRRRGAGSRNRKPKEFPSFLSETNNAAPSSDSPPGKAAPKGSKVKTPHAAGKRLPRASAASTSCDVTPTPSPTQPPDETHSTPSTASPTQAEEQTSEHSRLCSDPAPSTSSCTAEVSASQQSDVVESSSAEEPTSVSQYFLSDIFTEVDEG